MITPESCRNVLLISDKNPISYDFQFQDISIKTDLIFESEQIQAIVIDMESFHVNLSYYVNKVKNSKKPFLLGGASTMLNLVGDEIVESVNDSASKIETVKQSVFLPPGAKLSHIISGSGWVPIKLAKNSGIEMRNLETDWIACSITEEARAVAIERTSNRIQIATWWSVFNDDLPSGFNRLIEFFLKLSANVKK